MPVVQMPDGTLVDLPEKLTDDERRQLEAILAQSEPAPSPGKVFAKRAGLSVLPGVGGLAGAESGAAAGALAGSFFPGPGTAIGAGLGALLGGVGGSMLTSKAQEKILEAMPETREALGLDPETLAKEEEARGGAAMLGSLAGQAVSMGPSLSTLRQALGKGTPEEVLRARTMVGAGAGIGGGLTAGMQQIESPGSAPDWADIAEGTLAGGLFTKPTKRVGEPVSRAARRLVGQKVPEPRPGRPERASAVDATTRPPTRATTEADVIRPPLEGEEAPPAPDRKAEVTAADLIRGGKLTPVEPKAVKSVEPAPTEATPTEATPTEAAPVEIIPPVTPKEAERLSTETAERAADASRRRGLHRLGFPAKNEETVSAIDALISGKYVIAEGFGKYRNAPAETIFHTFDTKDEALAAAGRMTRKTGGEYSPTYIDIIEPNRNVTKLDRVRGGQYRTSKARVDRAVEEALVKTQTQQIQNEFASYPENFAELPRAKQLEAFDLVGGDFDPENLAQRDAVETKLKEIGLDKKDTDWLFSSAEARVKAKPDIPVADLPTAEQAEGVAGYEGSADFEQNAPLRSATEQEIGSRGAMPEEKPAKPVFKSSKEIADAYGSAKNLVDGYAKGELSFDQMLVGLNEFGLKGRLLDQVTEFDPRNGHNFSPKTNADRIWKTLKPYYGEVTPEAPPTQKRPTLGLKSKQAPPPESMAEAPVGAAPKEQRPTHTAETVLPALKRTFGIHTERLFKNGFLNVVANRADLPEGVTTSSPTSRAIYHVPTNKVYFIADNIPQDYNLKGLMLHETGVHAGMETMLGTKTYEKLLKEVADRAAKGEKPFKEASDRVPYTTPAANVDEERLAYIVSNYKDLPFVKRIYSQLRQWLYNKMGGRFMTLSNDDIGQMALASLKRVSDLAESGRTGELRRDAALAARAQRTADAEAARAEAANRELDKAREGFAEDEVGQTPPLSDAEKNQLDQENAVRDERRKINRKTAYGRLKNWFEDTKRDPYETQIRLFQDARRLLLTNDRRERAAGRLGADDPGLHGLATAMPSKLEGLRTAPLQKQVIDALQGLMESTGLSDLDVLAQFNRWMHGLTEPDLRKWLFTRYVPLRDKPAQLPDGRRINPAEAREVLAKAYETSNDLTAPDARQRYGYNADDIRDYMDYLVQNFAEPNGFTPDDAPPSIKTSLPDRSITDINSPAYDLTGVTQETAARWRAELEQQLAGEHGPAIQRVLDAEKALREETVRLEKLNGHWGAHVDNAIAVQRRSNYYTLKGDANAYNFDTITGTRLRGELGRVQGEMGGRTSMSDNPLTQTIADSNVALSRLDKKEFLDELYRQAKEGLLRDPRRNNTRVLKLLDPIKVGERNSYELPPDVSPDSIVLRPDGKGGYDVIQIKDDKWREAIKGIVTTQNFAMDTLASFTRGIASLATRWNVTFGPVNSVRDLSTNMSTIGAEYGYATGVKVGVRFFTQAAKGSAFKAARVANLVAKNDLAALERLAASDPYVKNLYDLIKEGGSTSYNAAFSNETATVQVVNDIKSRGITGATKQTLTHLADVYNNMFEYMNREAAYDTLRNKFTEEGGRDVNKRAALETLNLMNPALSGIYTKSLASWYAFMRASATGAVRGIDSVLMPLFMTPEEWVRKTYGSKYEIDTKADIERVLRNPQERQNALKYWEQRRKNAFLLAISSLGFGYAMREASKMLSDENEKGENRVATDNPSMWNRSLRIPTTILGPYKDSLGSDVHFINIPWGYGAGSFASIGAQISGMASGDYKPFDATRNIISVSKDSFLPVPTEDFSLFSRNPVGGVIASVAPTPVKPAIYFALNADYYGRQVYNTRLGRYADAYSGGDYVPEDFKDLSKTLYEASNGEIDIAPQSFQFFANNYFSGAANLLQSASGGIRTAIGQKEFSAKSDIPGLGGFLGVESDADAREFGDTEKNIQKIKTKLSTLENTNNVKGYEKFIREHPNAPYLVRRYDLIKNRINKYNKLLNDLRAADMPMKERKVRVDELRRMRSMYLKDLNDTYKMYEENR